MQYDRERCTGRQYTCEVTFILHTRVAYGNKPVSSQSGSLRVSVTREMDSSRSATTGSITMGSPLALPMLLGDGGPLTGASPPHLRWDWHGRLTGGAAVPCACVHFARPGCPFAPQGLGSVSQWGRSKGRDY
jgi:hypothetical protein